MRFAGIHPRFANEKRAVFLHAATETLYRRGIAISRKDRDFPPLKAVDRGKCAAERGKSAAQPARVHVSYFRDNAV